MTTATAAAPTRGTPAKTSPPKNGATTTTATTGAPARPLSPAQRKYVIGLLTARKDKLEGQLKACKDEIAMHKEALKLAK